jgi:hypothetical protein
MRKIILIGSFCAMTMISHSAYAHYSHKNFDIYSTITKLEQYANKHNDYYLKKLIKNYKRVHRDEFKRYKKHLKHQHNNKKDYYNDDRDYRYYYRHKWPPRHW